MTKRVAPVPKGYRNVTPQLVVRGAQAAIAFYREVFGAEVVKRILADDGATLLHGEIKIGNSLVRLCEGGARLWYSFAAELRNFGFLSAPLYGRCGRDLGAGHGGRSDTAHGLSGYQLGRAFRAFRRSFRPYLVFGPAHSHAQAGATGDSAGRGEPEGHCLASGRGPWQKDRSLSEGPAPPGVGPQQREIEMSKNAELLARREKAVPRGIASAAPVFAERAKNCRALGRGRPTLYRLCRRHRGAEHRPWSSQSDGGRGGAERQILPYRISGGSPTKATSPWPSV